MQKRLENEFKSGSRITVEGTLAEEPKLTVELKSEVSGFRLSGTFRSGGHLNFEVWSETDKTEWQMKTPPLNPSNFELTLEGVDNGIEVLSGAFELTYLKFGICPLKSENLQTLTISGSDFTVTNVTCE